MLEEKSGGEVILKDNISIGYMLQNDSLSEQCLIAVGVIPPLLF